MIAERSGKSGKSSIEFKCRTILDDRRRNEFRRQLQKDAYKWWPTAVEKRNHGWAERGCVLVEFRTRDADNWSSLRCDILPAESPDEVSNWRPLFGWASKLVNNSGAPSVRASEPKQEPPHPRSSQSADPSGNGTRKRAFSSAYAKCRACNVYGQEMRSVSDLVTEVGTPAAKRAKPTIGEKMPVWAKKFKWAPRAWARTPRLGSRTGGGRKGICATKTALEDIHNALS